MPFLVATSNSDVILASGGGESRNLVPWCTHQDSSPYSTPKTDKSTVGFTGQKFLLFFIFLHAEKALMHCYFSPFIIPLSTLAPRWEGGEKGVNNAEIPAMGLLHLTTIRPSFCMVYCIRSPKIEEQLYSTQDMVRITLQGRLEIRLLRKKIALNMIGLGFNSKQSRLRRTGHTLVKSPCSCIQRPFFLFL